MPTTRTAITWFHSTPDAPVTFVPADPLAPTHAEAVTALDGLNPGTIAWFGGTQDEPKWVWQVNGGGSVSRLENATRTNL